MKLISAVRLNEKELVRRAIQRDKKQINETDELGNTALMYAINSFDKKSYEISKMLIKAGAKINHRNNYNENVWSALNYNEISKMKLLLVHGVEINNKDESYIRNNTDKDFLLKYRPELLI